jgi:GAF domain-containing protein
MLGARLPLAEILEMMVRAVEARSGGDAVASVLLLDSEGRLRTGATPGLPAEYNAAIDGLQASPFLGTCSAAAATGAVVLTPDIAAHPYWSSLKHLPLALGLVAAWSQPIIGTDGAVLGTLGTYFRTLRGPTEAERRLVSGLAASAAVAIEQAREGRVREV